MAKYFYLDGSNDDRHCQSLEEAIETAANWYDFLDDEWQFPQFKGYDMTQRPELNQEGVETLEDLQNAVKAWEEQLAEFYGYQSYAGPGTSVVSARAAANFDLSITEKDDEEEDGNDE